ncbi:MAG: ATP-dependent helicase [Candidatus Komeilibacteria bacterium]|nr:ATP-dependent helicase [Candidatus Komeilibacteria bacterium]
MKVYKIKADDGAGKPKVEYRAELNDEQYRVVTEADGPCLVLAGAGSGKTRTVVYRVAHLLEQGIPAQQILLLTFTNKAAREMITRVESLLHNYPEGLWAGTYHHIANRILRKYAKVIDYESNFNILDSEDSRSLIKMTVKELEIDATQKRFPSAAVLQDLISYSRNSGKELEDVILQRHPRWIELLDKIQSVANLYDKKKKSANVMDFDDLLVNWLRLLKEAESVRRKLAEQFRYILVDEYQDSNHLQAQIIRLLASHHGNVLVVGDDAQSIYSFRAADIDNILEFPQLFPDSKTFKMETNYRSTPDILRLANDVIANNQRQFVKELRSVKKQLAKPQVVTCGSPRQEAQFITSLMLQLRDEGVPLNEMAVLFRAAHHSQVLEMELNKKDIPYEYRGGVRFFERAHIKDVVAFLKLVHNVKDDISWTRVLSLQVGVGPVTAERIIETVKNSHLTGPDDLANIDISSVLSAKAATGWQNLQRIFLALHKERDWESPAVLVRAVCRSEYRNYLEMQYPDWSDRLEDLEQLALFAESYDSTGAFISEVTLQEGFGVTKGQVDNYDDERVVLTTIHQAKGLEWKVVFVMNLVNNAFPNQRALHEEGGLEEERRLFYVAVTRAQDQLYLSYPVTDNYDGYLNEVSTFVRELNESHFEEARVSLGGDKFQEEIIEVDEEGNRSSWLPRIEDL